MRPAGNRLRSQSAETARVSLSDRGAAGRRRDRAARTSRRLLRLGAGGRSAISSREARASSRCSPCCDTAIAAEATSPCACSRPHAPDVIYSAELEHPTEGTEVIHTLTREQPSGWAGYARRVDPGLLSDVAWPAERTPCLRVRADELRRDGRRRPRRAGLPAAEGEDRAVRGDRRKLMEALDGNAIAGRLAEVFGAEMTTAASVLRKLPEPDDRSPSSWSMFEDPAPLPDVRPARRS